MIQIRLEPGFSMIGFNAKKLMKQGYSERDAYAAATRYANRHSKRRMEKIQTSCQHHQRKR